MTVKGIKAHQRYRTADGCVCPGVTTILGMLNKPALVPWAWKLGMQGLDYRKTLDQAANIGSIVHYLIECFLKKEKPYLDNYTIRDIQQAQVAFHNFEEWWNAKGLIVQASEIQLVSEKHRYGGTLDIVAFAKSQGRLLLLDTKTSKAIYPEHRYQVAAYWRLWDENHPEDTISEAYIIRLDKETGAIDFHSLGEDLSNEWNIFMHLRDIYELRGREDRKRRDDKDYRTPWWYD